MFSLVRISLKGGSVGAKCLKHQLVKLLKIKYQNKNELKIKIPRDSSQNIKKSCFFVVFRQCSQIVKGWVGWREAPETTIAK
jgi:hypothetical protein